MEASPRPHPTDLAFAHCAASGSIEAWQEFVFRYSALVLRTVRRYMMGFDAEDHRTVYVDVLKQLYDSGLDRYDGSVTLSSWVIIIARSRCLDAVRARYGRKRQPAWLRRVSAFDREVYRLFFVESLDIGATLAELQRQGRTVGGGEVAASLDRLDACIDSRLRTQLAYELYARSVGELAARLTRYSDDFRRRAAEAEEWSRPDAALVEQETRTVLERLSAQVERLPADERRALELRYWDGLSAETIAARMDLGSRRRAQRLIDRAIAQLRRTLKV